MSSCRATNAKPLPMLRMLARRSVADPIAPASARWFVWVPEVGAKPWVVASYGAPRVGFA